METHLDIRDQVLQSLRLDPGVPFIRIGVGVEGCTVLLSGVVRTAAERDAACSAALAVPGVCAIADEITLEDAHYADTDIALASEVRAVLLWNERLRGRGVTAEVRNGEVILYGRVAEAERATFLSVIAALSGVRSVDDRLTTLEGAASR